LHNVLFNVCATFAQRLRNVCAQGFAKQCA
jgi:hypothetical protein